jgi:AbrB family looped-hinge helix DNA binding protein
MASATLTSKGRVTIPNGVRHALCLDPGDRLDFVEVAPGRFEVIPVNRSVKELKGLASKRNRAVSLDEMNQAIAGRDA